MVQDVSGHYKDECSSEGGFASGHPWHRVLSGQNIDANDSPTVATDTMIVPEIRIDTANEAGNDHQAKRMPCEASEAVGTAAIPLPCPESLMNSSSNYSADIEHFQKEHLDENNHRYVGLVNQAMTCYLNSLVQTLYMTPEFRNAIYRWKLNETATNEANNNITFQLQKLFLLLQTSDKSSLETKELTASFGWESNEAYEQHDVQELCRIMFDALERCWHKTENQSVIQDLYKGTIEDCVKCLRCKTENVRKDVFLDLPLAVKQFGASESFHSIEEALKAFIKPEVLNGNNQYQCEVCNSRQNAEKSLRIIEFPYLLTIQLKRFDFDYQTLHRIKLNDRVTFPDYLDINEFVHVPSELSPPKLSYAAMAKKPKPDFVETSSVLSDVPCTSATPDGIGANCSSVVEQKQWLLNSNSRSENIAQLVKRGKYVYELFSIMVHQGSASAGHYFAYIKNLDQNRWFCFNDSSVHSALINDIYRTFGGYSNGWMNNTNAYMLIYRQIDPNKNKQFIRSIALPEHLNVLKHKLQFEEAERIRQRALELASVRVYYVCNEEHCIENEYSMLVDMNLPIDSVFDEILNKLSEADRSAAESGKCTCHDCTLNGGHLIEHSLVSCQRLIQCDHRWEFVKVLFEYETDDQSPEGGGEEMEPCVSCGDEPYKLPLSSVFQSDESSLMKFGQMELHLLVDTKSSARIPFYPIVHHESDDQTPKRHRRGDHQLRTFNVFIVDLGRKCVRFAKRIGLFDHQTVGELKIVLAKTIPAVTESEGISAKAEMDSEQGQKDGGVEGSERNDLEQNEHNRSRDGEESRHSEENEVTSKQSEQNEDGPSSTSSIDPLGVDCKQQELLQQQPRCRVVFDCPNTDENNPRLNVFADNFKPLYEAVFNRYGLVTVFVDVGPADCLLADRTVTDFCSTKMSKLILRHKFNQRMKILLPTKELHLRCCIDQPVLKNDEGEDWREQLLSEAVEDDPSMDLSSCPSTPQISPVVSEESDNYDVETMQKKNQQFWDDTEKMIMKAKKWGSNGGGSVQFGKK